MNSQTSKECLEWALKNVLNHHEVATDLQKAIVAAIRLVPDDEDKVPEHRQIWAKFCDEICSDLNEKNQRGPKCLDYRTDYVGQWTVENRDLLFLRQIAMWTGRSDDEQNGGWANILINKVGKAMEIKRLHQAYVRYQSSGLTREHCLLLAKGKWLINTWRGDGMSLYMNGKHPWGDSFKELSIYEICGWEIPWGEESPTNEQEERAWNLFDELVFALPDAAARAALDLV